MKTSKEETAFLAAIAAKPDDRAARLVYADWLEEQGDPRGDFVERERFERDYWRATTWTGKFLSLIGY